ncbi:MAG: PilN domain-containing protein [Pelotomaculum sp.]|jgi:Tfp pilus assembly protein PilN
MYKINLLPVELQKDLSIDVKGLVKRVSIAMTVILMFFGYGAFLFMGYLTQKEINDTERYLSQISSSVNIIEDIKAQRIKNEESTKRFKELLNTRLARSPMLVDLSYNMPVDLWLENIDLSYVAPEQTAANASSGAAQEQTAQPQPQGQAPASKQEAVSAPAPNTFVLIGYSRSVSSIGVFMNNLYGMPYFSSVVLNELNTDEKSGNVKFKLTAQLKETGK